MKAVSDFFLRLIARRFPQIWEILGGGPAGPGGPGHAAAGAQDRVDEVALNPQPLPPKAAAG
jgi:hypothetical protein